MSPYPLALALVLLALLTVGGKAAPPARGPAWPMVLVNQVGYAPGTPKACVLQAPARAGKVHPAFRVLDHRQRPVLEGKWGPAQTIGAWGPRYLRGDFSALTRPGSYRIACRVGRRDLLSPAFRIGRDLLGRETGYLAARFYYYQRCGTAVPGWHSACHLDDARLPDGTHLEAVGGWHDAGDYNKYNGYTPHSVYALAVFLDRRGRRLTADQQRLVGEEIRWGADWLCKMVRAEGTLWRDVFRGYGFWGPPEKETDNVPGTADDRPTRGEGNVPMVAAALARAARTTGEDRYQEVATRVFAACRPVLAGPGFAAERLLAALELGDEPQAAADAAALISGQQPDGSLGPRQVVSDGLPAAALALWADRTHDAKALAALDRYIAGLSGAARNPFGLLPWQGETMFYPYAQAKDWYVGQNSQYLSSAWALLLCHALRPSPQALGVALDQAGWVLGCNPFGVCMLEDRGEVNPPRYHHRYDSLPGHPRGAVPGTVCNGIVRLSVAQDRPRFDLVGNDYHSNEPWLPHNAYYLLMLSALPE